jgi:hypothetical protein
MSSDNCIHAAAGLCPDCQAARDDDPEAWEEFGDHIDGLRRYAELQAEMEADFAARAAAPIVDTSEWPL